MKRLRQEAIDLNPNLVNNRERLNELLKRKLSEGWRFVGPIGIYYIFERWEEDPVNQYVQPTGTTTPGYGGYGYNQGYGGYQQGPQVPGSIFRNSPGYGGDSPYTTNPFDDDYYK